MAKPELNRKLTCGVHFKITEADAEALRREADFDGLTTSDVARAALKLWLNKRAETADARMAIKMGWSVERSETGT